VWNHAVVSDGKAIIQEDLQPKMISTAQLKLELTAKQDQELAIKI